MNGPVVPRKSAKKSREQKPVRDPTGKWARQVHALADRFNWYRVEMWLLFDELACLLEFESKRLSRAQSEESAFSMLEAVVDKTERVPS